MSGSSSQEMPLRILIVAEHASVRFGGEASLPYHYFRVLRSRGADAWLVVHERTREELLSLFPEDADRIRFVPDMLLQKIFYRASLLLPRRISEATFGLANQLLTQWAQRGIVRELARGHRAVVHQPIPVSPRFPSLLSGLDLPVVIGPMNGGMDYPPAFRREESPAVRLLIGAGRSASALVHRLLPGKRNAYVLLVANPRTASALPFEPRGRVVQLVENGVDLRRWTEAPQPGPGAGNRFLFLGRLVDWKALDIVLRALVDVPQATLDVVGDGPMRAPWEQLAAELRLSARVHFHGWKSQEECASMLRGATALVLPSLYECGGAVVLEAMAMRRPVIATSWGGPEDYLDGSCGILVAPTSRESMTNDFAAAMQQLSQSPELCRTMGDAGRAKIEAEYDWEKKVTFVEELYREAAGLSTEPRVAAAESSYSNCDLSTSTDLSFRPDPELVEGVVEKPASFLEGRGAPNEKQVLRYAQDDTSFKAAVCGTKTSVLEPVPAYNPAAIESRTA